MPIYEFDCAACGHNFDRLQKLSDPDPAQCPACNAAGVKRRVSAPSFRLSGSGWYETDFKGDKDKKRNLAGGEDASKPASSDSGTPKTSGNEGPSKSGGSPAPASADSKPAAAPAKSSTPTPSP